jgi:hypothetical protein
MSELQKVKQLMGLGFGGSVVTAVEAQKKLIDDLKVALGLPQDASLGELQEKVSVIKAEHEEFMQKNQNGKPVPPVSGKSCSGASNRTRWGKRGRLPGEPASLARCVGLFPLKISLS